MITWGEDGRITEFAVMVRPVKALHKLMELMAAEPRFETEGDARLVEGLVRSSLRAESRARPSRANRLSFAGPTGPRHSRGPAEPE